MPAIADLPLVLRTVLRFYHWRQIDPVPCAPLRKPLDQCRVALVSTGGLVAPGQAPFDKSVKGGDFSYRVIPADTRVQELIETHRSEAFDPIGIAADRNLAFPLDRVHELAAAGTIDEVAPRHLSFMGSITAPGRLIKRTAPEAAQLLVHDQVDIALLVPVWPFCHQTVCLIQAEIERRGITTASLTCLPEITAKVRPPRALVLPYPLGYPLGAANEPARQRRILEQLLHLCATTAPTLTDYIPQQPADSATA